MTKLYPTIQYWDIQNLYLNDIDNAHFTTEYTKYLESINMTLFMEATRPTIDLKECYYGSNPSRAIDCTNDWRHISLLDGQCIRLSEPKKITQKKLTVELSINRTDDSIGWSSDLPGLTLYFNHPSEVSQNRFPVVIDVFSGYCAVNERYFSRLA